MALMHTAESDLNTEYGKARIAVFVDAGRPDKEHVALIYGKIGEGPVLTRIHSECVTGDTLHSLHCDCGAQKDAAMERIAAEGGVFLYLRQEGRGVGLTDKIRGYKLQAEGLDTVEAHEKLKLPIDARDYGIAADIYKLLGIRSVRLLTNNPDKVQGLLDSGIEVAERVPLVTPPHAGNKKYLDTKKTKLNHLL